MKWPTIFSKRGDETRKLALQVFNVTPIFKTKLLPGQKKKGYHRQNITTDYCVFLFETKTIPVKKGIFICGLTAAKEWIELIKKNKTPIPMPIPSYNPLSSAGTGTGTTQTVQVANNNNEQMTRLIHCLESYISISDNTLNNQGEESAALKILQGLLRRRAQAPSISDIRAVNTTFAKVFSSPNYLTLGINSYTDLINYKNPTYGNKLRIVTVSDFNIEISKNLTFATGGSYKYKPSF